jgi:hypothetical protein
MTGRRDPRTANSNMTGRDQRSRGATRTHHASMPEPLVDALGSRITPVRFGGLRALVQREFSVTVFGIGFELLLERGELGEG